MPAYSAAVNSLNSTPNSLDAYSTNFFWDLMVSTAVSTEITP